MRNIKFIKMHGLGNDFVIIDKSENEFEINKKETLKKIGSRNFTQGISRKSSRLEKRLEKKFFHHAVFLL